MEARRVKKVLLEVVYPSTKISYPELIGLPNTYPSNAYSDMTSKFSIGLLVKNIETLTLCFS
jgi:hypothetical protein